MGWYGVFQNFSPGDIEETKPKKKLYDRRESSLSSIIIISAIILPCNIFGESYRGFFIFNYILPLKIYRGIIPRNWKFLTVHPTAKQFLMRFFPSAFFWQLINVPSSLGTFFFFYLYHSSSHYLSKILFPFGVWCTFIWSSVQYNEECGREWSVSTTGIQRLKTRLGENECTYEITYSPV